VLVLASGFDRLIGDARRTHSMDGGGQCRSAGLGTNKRLEPDRPTRRIGDARVLGDPRRACDRARRSCRVVVCPDGCSLVDTPITQRRTLSSPPPSGRKRPAQLGGGTQLPACCCSLLLGRCAAESPSRCSGSFGSRKSLEDQPVGTQNI